MIPGLWIAMLMSHVAHTYLAGLLETIVPSFKICFFGVLIVCVLDRPSRLRQIARVFVAGSCLMAVHALLQEKRGVGFGGLPPINLWKYTPDGPVPYCRTVFFGIFADPNDLAQILATSIPFAFVITRRRSALSLPLSWGIVWLLVKGILSTHSRGGMLALIAAAVTVVFMGLRGRWQPYVAGILIAAALALCPFSAPVLDDSARDRVIYWGVANQAFKRTPLFGIGAGMLGEFTRGSAAHNAFVHSYSEIGVFGYWFWFGLILMGLVGAWRSRTALARFVDPDSACLRRFANAAICAMVGYCASAYFLSRAFVHPCFLLTALLAGTYVATRNHLGPENIPSFNLKRDVYLLNTVVSLASIVYIYISIILINRVWRGGG
jgi:hypothetical protein